MLFYLALLPTVVSLSDLSWVGFGQLVAVVALVYGVVLCSYTLLAARARGLFRSARAMRIVNRSTGTVMAGAAVAVATRG